MPSGYELLRQLSNYLSIHRGGPVDEGLMRLYLDEFLEKNPEIMQVEKARQSLRRVIKESKNGPEVAEAKRLYGLCFPEDYTITGRVLNFFERHSDLDDEG